MFDGAKYVDVNKEILFTINLSWRFFTISGRLHRSRTQNKRLYMPWTKDYSHTRQDRWIQTELAFTLAKNATKPDPVEIISLQTIRKENNWKTEETLARTVVTLETEQIRLVQSLVYRMMMVNKSELSPIKFAEWDLMEDTIIFGKVRKSHGAFCFSVLSPVSWVFWRSGSFTHPWHCSGNCHVFSESWNHSIRIEAAIFCSLFLFHILTFVFCKYRHYPHPLTPN